LGDISEYQWHDHRVKGYILKSQQVEQERIFLTEPKAFKPEQKENVKDSRVDFKLK